MAYMDNSQAIVPAISGHVVPPTSVISGQWENIVSGAVVPLVSVATVPFYGIPGCLAVVDFGVDCAIIGVFDNSR